MVMNGSNYDARTTRPDDDEKRLLQLVSISCSREIRRIHIAVSSNVMMTIAKKPLTVFWRQNAKVSKQT